MIKTNQALIYLCYVDSVAGTTNVTWAVSPYGNTPEAFGAGTNLIGDDAYDITNRIFQATISDVAVFNTALTTDQIAAQFGTAAGITQFPPSVSGTPMSVYGYQGASSQFKVAGAYGSVLVNLQWQFDGSDIAAGPNFSGVNTTTLTINSVAATNVGTYQLIATEYRSAAIPAPLRNS